MSAWKDHSATDTLGAPLSGAVGASRQGDPALPGAHVFRDREGLPVTYDAAIHKKV